MKCCSMRTLCSSLTFLCVLIGLPGCVSLLNINPVIRAMNEQQEEQKKKAAQMVKVSELKQELPAVKEQERKKESVKQENSENIYEPDDLLPQDAYGSNDAATPISFTSLSPAEKAALHWAAAQEYRKVHSVTSVNYKEAEPLSEIHGISAAAILETAWANPKEINKIINAFPLHQKSFERWRAKTIEKHNSSEELRHYAVTVLDQRQKDEQLNSSLNRHGCEWMTGKYYIDSNPTSLCTPVIGKCVEGNCDNGHGTYISFDGSKFVGEFKGGSPFMKDSIYGYGRCLKGNCDNGHGTYVFRDGTKYEGDFKNAKPHGQGTKTWAIGFSYTGEFKDGEDTGQGNYTPLAKRNLSGAICLKGNCTDGEGTQIYENDTKYVGQFKYGQPNGQGIYYWRTGEALEGEFEKSELKPGGRHISPDGSIVVQNISRGWQKTYAEEKASALSRANAEEGKRLMREMLFRGIIGTVEGRKIDCSEYHQRGTAEWYKCGGN